MKPSEVKAWKEALAYQVERYAACMRQGRPDCALTNADAIRNIGLQLGSDAWNRAVEKPTKKTAAKRKK